MGAAGEIEERDRKSSPPVSPGDTLLGKYRVERVLGEGTMGTIFAVLHVEEGELYALKILTQKALASSQAVERFLREARALARLRGAHVAQVHEVARLPGGAPCMVMEYLHGSDLQEILKARGRPAIHEALEWMIQACEGVAEAHAIDIVHRDIKPANLFVSPLPDGGSQVRVLDFGIAKLVERDGPFDHELTQVGMVFGTPAYMSPEQMRQTKDVDARTDIWSLGVVLYELLTGALPFSPAAGVMDLALRISVDTPPRPGELRPEVPPALDAVVMGCLEKKPERRPQTALELADALRSVLASLPIDGRGSLDPVPPAPMSAKSVPVAPASVRAAVPPAPVQPAIPPSPASRRGAPIEPVPVSGGPRERGVPRWALAAAALVAVTLVTVGVLAVWAHDPGPATGVTEAPSGTSMAATAPPTHAEAPPSPPASSPAIATAPPVPTAPLPTAGARPAPISRPTRPKSFNACFTTADCRRGKRCIQGWCK